jgi:hypothetical protein
MKGNPMARSALRTAVALSICTLALSACSVSVTSNDNPEVEASASVEASAEASPNASEAAAIDADIYNFCRLEAEGSLDFILILGDQASDGISDGISQSISQQELTGIQAESCKAAWIETLAANGIEYVDPDGGAPASAAPAASPSSS